MLPHGPSMWQYLFFQLFYIPNTTEKMAPTVMYRRKCRNVYVTIKYMIEITFKTFLFQNTNSKIYNESSPSLESF